MFKNISIEPCVEPLWAKGAHGQTILGHLLPSPKIKTRGTPWKISLPDGGSLVAHYFHGTSDTLIHLFHGLGGHAFSDYMQRTALVCQQLGHSVLLVNHRGCGDGHGLAEGIYHSGCGDDVSQVLATTKNKFPTKKHIAIGFSLSGNALLLLLAKMQDKTLPDAAIAINAPINLFNAATQLGQRLNRIYDLRFVWQCRHRVRSQRKYQAYDKQNKKGHYNIQRFATLKDVDEIYTAPAGGFNDREHYYTSCSTYQLLDNINVPTVLITAKDDPFIPFNDYSNAKRSPQVHLHAESIGGHMGYLTSRRTPLGTYRWLDYALREYIIFLVTLSHFP